MVDREKVIADLEFSYSTTLSGYAMGNYGADIHGITGETLSDALALLKAQEPITGETSDGYHTFNELYHHRAVLFSVIVANYPDRAWKSKKHHDGTMYDGMFIVGIDTPDGQATYHYDIDPYWDMFKCRVLDNAPEWDGHTPAQAIERIGKLKAQEAVEPTVHEGTSYCGNCGDPINKLDNYCHECGRAVKWGDDLISRAAAIGCLGNSPEQMCMPWSEVERMLRELPAVDAAPVVHARWISYPECLGYDGAYSDDHIVCSNCKSVWSIIDNDTERFDYCPACGAKMDGEA